MSNITNFNAPSESTRKRLLMQQKVNKRSAEAMTQREITPEILPTKADVKLLGLDDDYPEAIAEKHRKATSIKIQLANMSNNAIVDELGWKPSKIKSEITQQMIDEYKAEMNTPVKVVDPITGREVVYKYKPTSIDLSPIPPEVNKTLTMAEKASIRAQIIKKLADVRDINNFISVIAPRDDAQLDTDYNHDKAVYDALPTIGDIPAGIDPFPNYKRDKEALKEAVERAEEDRKQHELDIAGLQLQVKTNDEMIHKNNINVAEAQKQTRLKVSKAEEELRILNLGQGIPGQQPGEDDEAYRQRLINVGREVLDDEEIEREAGALQMVRAKYNLKDFVSDDAKIETILKKLTDDERTLFNTKIASIKKSYLDTYGFNNKNMTVDKIVDFIKNEIAVAPAPAAPAPAVIAPPPPGAPAAAPPTVLGPPELPAHLKSLTAGEQIKEIGKINKQYGKTIAEVIIQLDGIGVQIPAETLKALVPRSQNELLNNAFMPDYVLDVLRSVKPPPPGLAAAEPEPVITAKGLGVHLKKLPKVIKLGHIHINPSNLYYENILSVRNPKNKPLRAYRDEHVSEYLASLLIKLIEGGHITKHELQPLSDHEKMIYDNLIKRSKLHKMHDNTFEATATKMKDRLLVLEGELEAGNTNDKIKSEIHGLLFKLAHAKVISSIDATKHWKSLNEIY